MHAEILTIGDELLSGQLLDTNTQWLSLRLAELGVRTLYHSSVGDELEPMADVFRHAMARADIVIATGGLGPTTDDLTRDAIARALGRKLVRDEEALEHIRGMFARRSRPMPARNELQALFPEGSRVVRNPHGTAPGIELDVARAGAGPCRIIALPGVPAEIKEMWHDSVAASLRGFGAGGRTIRFKQIKCFGAGESQIEAMLPEGFMRSQQPPVGINASGASIIFRLSGEGATEAECYAAMEPVAATLHRALGTLVFGEDDDELQDAVVRLLRQHRKTLAVAECGTAGLVVQWLGGAAQAGSHFVGGVVLRPDASGGGSAADSDMVRVMAADCREHFAADYALAVGPFAITDPQNRESNSVLLALAGPEGITVKATSLALHPAIVRIYAAKQALNLARLTLMES
jgi:nicotinamide-nucleotide amidase